MRSMFERKLGDLLKATEQGVGTLTAQMWDLPRLITRDILEHVDVHGAKGLTQRDIQPILEASLGIMETNMKKYMEGMVQAFSSQSTRSADAPDKELAPADSEESSAAVQVRYPTYAWGGSLKLI